MSQITDRLVRLANNHRDTEVRMVCLQAMYRIEELESALEKLGEGFEQIAAVAAAARHSK